MAKEVQLKQNVGDQVIARVNSLCEVGFTIPKGYSVVNAIKASMLVLQDLKDKNGKSALEVCTPVSIQKALFFMATKGLDASKNTAYFLVRGNQLCLHESYFGKVCQVKRIYPNWTPCPVVIRDGDDFEMGIDVMTGKKFVKKHETKLENMDKGFVGGYLYLPTGECYVMSKAQILMAWSKSSSREKITHRDFSEKMVAKTLVNSGCNMIINSTPELNENAVNDDYSGEDRDFAEYEEVEEEENAKIEHKTENHEQTETSSETKPQEIDDNF